MTEEPLAPASLGREMILFCPAARAFQSRCQRDLTIKKVATCLRSGRAVIGRTVAAAADKETLEADRHGRNHPRAVSLNGALAATPQLWLPTLQPLLCLAAILAAIHGVLSNTPGCYKKSILSLGCLPKPGSSEEDRLQCWERPA